MIFPVVMYGCESWTIKKADRGRINAFEMWCWRRLLKAPWTAKRSNHSILKEINPEFLLERHMLKLQYFGHLMQRTDSLEKTLVLGKIESRGEGDDRGWDGWMASPTRWTWVWVSYGVGDGLACCSPWGCKELGMPERLNWTELGLILSLIYPLAAGDESRFLCCQWKFPLSLKSNAKECSNYCTNYCVHLTR